jgi:hypothetical protein
MGLSRTREDKVPYRRKRNRLAFVFRHVNIFAVNDGPKRIEPGLNLC